MTKYQIVKASSSDDLVRDVNYYLEMGWEPFGGVSVASKTVAGMRSFVYVQAMVLDDRRLEDKVA